MRKEILSLTGLRGLAALSVALYHYEGLAPTFGSQSRYAIPHGYLAVEAFFILSGFVMAYNYPELKFGTVRPADYMAFLVKRFARIYPAYWFAMFVFAGKGVFNVSGDGRTTAYSLIDYLAGFMMAAGWGVGARPFVGTSWSVSAEVLCYLAFPLIVTLALSRKAVWRLALLLAALCGLVLVTRSGLSVDGPLNVTSRDSLYPALRAFGGFSLGCLTCDAVNRTAPWRSGAADLVAALGAVLTMLFVLTSWSDIAAEACLMLVIAGLAFDGPAARLVFGNRLMIFLGEVSYSLYLIHVLFATFVLRIVTRMAHGGDPPVLFWTGVVAYVAVCLAASFLMYRFVERPARDAIVGLIYRRRAVPRPAQA